ncbi:hypothetical protein [Treponema sp.]|uniref:hypothetical protein n=1 Tax=Treponema TaxID=157 RepID=UPI00338EA7DA
MQRRLLRFFLQGQHHPEYKHLHRLKWQLQDNGANDLFPFLFLRKERTKQEIL